MKRLVAVFFFSFFFFFPLGFLGWSSVISLMKATLFLEFVFILAFGSVFYTRIYSRIQFSSMNPFSITPLLLSKPVVVITKYRKTYPAS